MTRRRRQAGLTLVEVLVSVTILALAMTTALVLYDDARRSFKLSENVIDQQQVVRIAFDMMASDVRMAGFNHNPDAADDRPDEQIEAAFATALVLRADLDNGTAEALAPEADLATAGLFDTVTTGNDEIVGYVLGGPSGTQQMVYHADVGGQTRDGATEQVTVTAIAMAHTAPPYVLYRVTLNADASVVKTPLADNIRAMGFRYFDQAGRELTAPGGAETAAARRVRASIRRVVIEIEGLTRDPDNVWIDPTDTNLGTRHHRKFRLSGDVTPRNLGMKGLADLPGSLVLPAPPITPVLVAGHCRGLYVRWTQPPPEQWHYLVGYEDADGATGEMQAGGLGAYVGGLVHNRMHDVWIRAVDPYGNLSEPTDKATRNTTEMSPPREAVDLTVSGGLPGQITLAWSAVTANEVDIPGDPASPLLRDFRRYRVLRKKSTDAAWNIIGSTNQTDYTDDSAVACTAYEYRIRAEDLCGSYAEHTYEETGISASDDAPGVPEHVEAFWVGGDVSLTWQPVDWTVTDEPTEVASYRVYRVLWTPGEAPDDLGLYTLVEEILADTVPLRYVDDGVTVPPGQEVFYRLVAVDGCGNASEASSGIVPENCQFTGSISFLNPAAGEDTSGSNSVRVDVQGGSEVYSAARLVFTDHETGIPETTISCPTPALCAESSGADWVAWTTTWFNDGRPHQITATVWTDVGCEMSRSILVGPGLGDDEDDDD